MYPTRMTTVPYFTSFSPFSPTCLAAQPHRLLAAPPPRLLLPAPRIAGLLPATVTQAGRACPAPTPRPIPIADLRVQPSTNPKEAFYEYLAARGPVLTEEAADAEIYDMLMTKRRRRAARARRDQQA